MKSTIRLLLAGLLVLPLFGVEARAQNWNVSLCDQLPYWSNAKAVVAHYPWVYVADEIGGLRIVDVSDPTAPLEIGIYDGTDCYEDLAWADDKVYLLRRPYGYYTHQISLQVVDVSNPYAPIQLSDTTFFDGDNTDIYRIAVAGSHLCISAGALLIYDISTPSQPSLQAIYDETSRGTEGVDVEGNYIYLSQTSPPELKVLNITDPTQPVVEGWCTLWATFEDLVISDDYIYGVSYEVLQMVDVSNPANPILLSTAEFAGGMFNGVDVSGSYACLSSENGNEFAIVDISVPAQPVPMGTIQYDPAYGVALNMSCAYLANGCDALKLIDISNAGEPQEISTAGVRQQLRDMALYNQYAYVVANPGDLLTVDISDPNSLSQVACQSIYGGGQGIVIENGYAYYAESYGLHILDLSEPQTPSEVGNIYGNFNLLTDLDAANGFVYVPADHFWIYDVTNPQAPSLASESMLFGQGYGAEAFGDYIAVSSYNWSGFDAYYFRVINVSNPYQPVMAATLDMPHICTTIEISGNFAFTAEPEFGISVIDITDPLAPFAAACLELQGGAWDLSIQGNHLVTASDQGFSVVDISDPLNPMLMGCGTTIGTPQAIALGGNYAYVAATNYFYAFDVSEALSVQPEPEPVHPSSFRLHPCHPNPFNPSTVLSFDLPAASLVKLEVFDINGRDVGAHCMRPEGLGTRSVPLQAGTHQIPFDGSGLPSGIYLARLTAGDFSAVQKLVLMK